MIENPTPIRNRLSDCESKVSSAREELSEARRRAERQAEAADGLQARLAEERQAREEAQRQSANKWVHFTDNCGHGKAFVENLEGYGGWWALKDMLKIPGTHIQGQGPR